MFEHNYAHLLTKLNAALQHETTTPNSEEFNTFYQDLWTQQSDRRMGTALDVVNARVLTSLIDFTRNQLSVAVLDVETLTVLKSVFNYLPLVFTALYCYLSGEWTEVKLKARLLDYVVKFLEENEDACVPTDREVVRGIVKRAWALGRDSEKAKVFDEWLKS